jgi:MOSC domain-containing protein YiiM
LEISLKHVNLKVRVGTLLIGSLAPLGLRNVSSAIAKTPVQGPIFLGRAGLATDQQGDLKHHGGPDKAVHHYSIDHYQTWSQEIGARDVLTRPGAFGENFSSTGMNETQIAIGDVFSVGGAIVQVSQGRQPCWKLNLRFDVPDMALRVQQSGRTGWYYRVLQQGLVEAGDELVPLDRSSPEWTIDRVRRLFYVDPLNSDGLAALVALPHLAEEWREYAAQRLKTRQVEDWAPRLCLA